MANKTLSQVVGAGGVEIGDIIKTRATSLTDGKVLLDCDGSTLTPGSYPLLEALFNTGKGWAQGFTPISSDGSSHEDNVATIHGRLSALADNGTTIAVIDDDVDVWFQNATATSETVAFIQGLGNIVMSADGQEVLVGVGQQGGTNDLIAHYSTSGGAPSSTVNIETTDVMQSTAYTCINKAGTSGLVISYNSTDSTLDTYISGANIGTGYTLANAAGSLGGVGNPVNQPSRVCWTDDLNGIALLNISTGGGVWITSDRGANWTEEIDVPSRRTIVGIAIDQSDNLYALDSSYDVIWKTADKGTTWTRFLHIDDVASQFDFAAPGFQAIYFADLCIDANDNWYFFINSFNGGDQSGMAVMHRIGVLYSGDQGTTWEYSDLNFVGGITTADYWQTATTAKYGFNISQNGTSIMWGGFNSTNPRLYVWAGGATGTVLPRIPGHKIVADAP